MLLHGNPDESTRSMGCRVLQARLHEGQIWEGGGGEAFTRQTEQ